LKLDLFPDEVYTFTPKGEVFAFPRGATPVDFAYRIHTDVGHHCVGARVNGRLLPLKTPLSNGDRIEVLTSPVAQPSRDWLSFVVTSRARNKIRAFIHSAEKDRAIEVGRRLLEKELKKAGKRLAKLLDTKAFDSHLPDFGAARTDDLLADIGFGKLVPKFVVTKLFPPSEEDGGAEGKLDKPSALRAVVRKILPFVGSGIRVKGENDLLVALAECCKPVPGDEVVGYITRGRGVSVHAAVCPNVKSLLLDPSREIEVEWEPVRNSSFTVDMEIFTEDRQGMLARITKVISDAESNIQSIEARAMKDGTAAISATLTTADRKHLDRLLVAIRGVAGVTQVRRKFHTQRVGGPVPVPEK
jgi:GTP pyrophosphokinase